MKTLIVLFAVGVAVAAHAQPEMVFGKLRYAICNVGDKDTILRNQTNLAHLHCPASGGAYNGLPERSVFDQQMKQWQQGADALRAAGVHPITYIAPDMWYGDPEKRTLIFDFYDKRWNQYEDYLGPRPAEPLAWGQVKADGSPIPYVYEGMKGYYWCTNQPADRQYVQGVIKMHVQYGSHGIFFDGPMNHGCFCGECEKQFREFLRTRYPEATRERILNGTKLEDVKLPQDKANLPLWAALRRFRCESLAKFLGDMRAWGRSLCPDFILTNNYCMWSGDPLGMVGIGEHPELYAPQVDILFDEAAYGGGPFMQDDGTRFSNGFHYDYLVAAAGSKPAVCTYLGIKDVPAEAKGNLAWLEIAESWASQCGKMQQTCNDAPIVEAFTQAGEFQVRHPELFAPAKPLADVGVWVSLQQALVGAPHYGMAMPRLLSDAGIACRVLTDADITADGLKGLKCLVAAGVPAVSDQQLVAIWKFMEAGGGMVAIGPTATMDDNGLPRETAASQPFGVGPETGQTQVDVGKGRLAWLSAREINGMPGYSRTALPADMVTKVGGGVRWAGRDQLLLAQAPPLPCEIRLYSVAPDRWRIYLVNYGVTKAGAVTDMKDLRFTMRLPGKMKVVSATASSTDDAALTPQKLAVTEQAGQATLTVPTLHIWCAVDVRLK